jgi:hypothetical protein
MTINDIDRVLTVCREHLEKTTSKGTEVESFLTKYLLVYICGEYEKEIERIVVQRAEKTGDLELAAYLRETGVGRGLKIKNLKEDLLARFSDKYVKAFEGKLKEKSITMYSNIVVNRHASAHGGSNNMTFDELLESYRHSKEIMDALSEVLAK